MKRKEQKGQALLSFLPTIKGFEINGTNIIHLTNFKQSTSHFI